MRTLGEIKVMVLVIILFSVSSQMEKEKSVPGDQSWLSLLESGTQNTTASKPFQNREEIEAREIRKVPNFFLFYT